MFYADDFYNLDDATKDALVRLLSQEGVVWDDVTHEEVQLKYRIIKHLSADGTRVKYEVIDFKPFAQGGYGDLYPSLATLSINSENKLEVKIKAPGKLRLVKEQHVKEENENWEQSKQRVHFEVSTMKASGIFHIKPLVVN